MSEVVRYDNLMQYLLRKNGNYLFKVPFRGGWAVLKDYRGSRSRFAYMKKSFTNMVYYNQTSFMPRGRLKTELACMRLWREAGFRVFDTYDDVIVEGLPEGLYALFEYVDRPKFIMYFADKSVPLEEKLEVWRRFLPVWHRRLALAIERREARLIHENGDMKHVMIMPDGGFLFFDFEMAYRSPNRVPEFVAHEMLAYLKSLCKTVGRDQWQIFMKETALHFPDRKLLRSAYEFQFEHPNPLLRMGRLLDRLLRLKNRKYFSKYNVARRLRDIIDAA
jgi:hypothetical protein